MTSDIKMTSRKNKNELRLSRILDKMHLDISSTIFKKGDAGLESVNLIYTTEGYHGNRAYKYQVEAVVDDVKYVDYWLDRKKAQRRYSEIINFFA